MYVYINNKTLCSSNRVFFCYKVKNASFLYVKNDNAPKCSFTLHGLSNDSCHIWRRYFTAGLYGNLPMHEEYVLIINIRSMFFYFHVDNGYDFAIARVYEELGHVDPNGAQTIKNARAAGIDYVDGYIFPCLSCGNPGQQVFNYFLFLIY